MVRWVLDKLDISGRHIETSKGTIIGYSHRKYLQKMYNLPQPRYVYNKQFVEAFVKENGHLVEKIR